ncbi:hypothetical protein TG4357_01253 [Thalassovita gelatinovora]|uniref:DUF4136 domain-containing protein n=1 Tax=Thalassovita gelatinovora TaxID=53501 RepID=A0A0N7LUT5_THAGE|nr:hypothetical protein [Thalassovita gelatinovora]QIZ81389.1 hypothetical protein HFZ77_13335 [Thalassovita gelatinovora]CUH64394.1 hypothetical protein TG4357_01253 [Thalassovita gelatinovora]SER20469.1 hypothetical protein SAMN04488043_1222 [Thalassovita gelatinovora]
MLSRFAALIALLAVVACTNANDLDKEKVDLGDFSLGHNIVVAPKVVKGPLSRSASEDEWKTVLGAAIDERFGRYDGARLYHFGTSVEGYVLAQPGVPIVASPKSVLIINLTVWDDAKGVKLTEKPEQLTILESLSGETLLGSGLTQSKEIQMRNLSRNAAKVIQNYLVKMQAEAGWFRPETATAD